jgi:hypothetical protein
MVPSGNAEAGTMRAKRLIAASALLLGATLATIAATFAQGYYGGFGLPQWPFMDTTRYGYDPASSNSSDIAQYGHLYDYAPDYNNSPAEGREGRFLASGVLWGPPVQMDAYLTSLGIGPQGNFSSGIGSGPSLYSPATSISVSQLREAFNSEAASFGPPTDRFTLSTRVGRVGRATAP